MAGPAVEALSAGLRAVAVEHVAGLDRLAAAYLGDRDGLEQLTRKELARRLGDPDTVVWDVRPTAEYLGFILSRITLPGALYLALISVLPNLFINLVGGNLQNFPFGGTAVLIIVGVGLETVKQIESQLMQRNYEGFLR